MTIKENPKPNVDALEAFMMRAADHARCLFLEGTMPVNIDLSADEGLVLSCPHCGQPSTEWIEVDWAEYRELTGHLNGDPRRPVIRFGDQDVEYHTLAHGCPNCRAFVTLDHPNTPIDLEWR